MTPASLDLIEKAQQGNPSAAGQLYQMYHQAVFRYLYYSAGDISAAEDLTGDVFLKMIQALPKFQPRAQGFQTWLFQIARHTAIDEARRRKVNQVVVLEEDPIDSVQTPAVQVEHNLESQTLNAALQRLSPDQRDVVVMRFVVRLSLAEVAATLHRSEDAVKGLQRRGLAALRQILTGQEVKDDAEG